MEIYAPKFGCFLIIFVAFNINHVCSVFFNQSTIVAILMDTTNLWKIFHHRVNREHYENFIGIT